jgi:hypothetical protein
MDLPKDSPRRTRTHRAVGLLQRSFSYLLLAGLLAGCGASGGGEDSASTSAAPSTPGVSFAASPAFVPDNGSSTLTWSVSNALSCQASGGWSGAKPANGSFNVGPLSESTVYLLTCRGAGGLTTEAATVTVGNTPPPTAPTVSLAANPTSVGLNETTNLTWSSSNATTCAAFGDWSGTKAISGNETVGPLAASSNFILVCSGAGGSASQSVTVTVNAPPPPPVPTVSLTANPTSVAYNGSSTLTWSSTNATSCTASGAWSGSRATSGSQTRSSLTATSTFILTCTGAGGSASRSVTVSVAPPPLPTVSLSANPTSVAYNGSSTLNWSTTNATSCTAGGAWSGTKPINGSQSVGPLTQDSTFSLSCTGPGGTTTRPVTVTVSGTPPPPPPSGSLVPGQPFTVTPVTGSFSAKARPEPLLFDDFATATAGSNISGRIPPIRNGGYSSYTWAVDNCGGGAAVYDNADPPANSQRYAKFSFTTGNIWCNQFHLGDNLTFANQGDQFYLSFRQKTARHNNAWPRQSKSWILYDSSWQDHLYFSTAYDNCEGGGWRQHVTAGANDASIGRSGRQPPADAWARLENWVVNSGSGASNGKWWSWIFNEDGSGVSTLKRNSIMTRSGSSSTWKRLTLGGAYYDPCSGTYPTADILISDVYLDDTPQRVEVCNAPAFAQCTLRAVQPASAWSGSSITATFRKGMLKSGDAYVYVIGPDGNPESGGANEYVQQMTIQ